MQGLVTMCRSHGGSCGSLRRLRTGAPSGSSKTPRCARPPGAGVTMVCRGVLRCCCRCSHLRALGFRGFLPLLTDECDCCRVKLGVRRLWTNCGAGCLVTAGPRADVNAVLCVSPGRPLRSVPGCHVDWLGTTQRRTCTPALDDPHLLHLDACWEECTSMQLIRALMTGEQW